MALARTSSVALIGVTIAACCRPWSGCLLVVRWACGVLSRGCCSRSDSYLRLVGKVIRSHHTIVLLLNRMILKGCHRPLRRFCNSPA